MKTCPHKGMSYHDANRCNACAQHYRTHTRYDKDGDPYYDPEGSEDGGGLVGLIIIAVLVLWFFFH